MGNGGGTPTMRPRDVLHADPRLRAAGGVESLIQRQAPRRGIKRTHASSDPVNSMERARLWMDWVKRHLAEAKLVP